MKAPGATSAAMVIVLALLLCVMGGCHDEEAATDPAPARAQAEVPPAPSEPPDAVAVEVEDEPEAKSKRPWKAALVAQDQRAPAFAADGRQVRQWWERPRLAEELALTDAQREAIAAAADRVSEPMAKIGEDLASAESSASDALAAGDLSGLQLSLDRVADLERARRQLENELLVQSLAQLEPEQREQLLSEPRRARRLLSGGRRDRD